MQKNYKRNKRENLLEKLVQPILNTAIHENLLRYCYVPIKYEDLDKDYMSGAKIIQIPSSHLPSGVLGLYHPVSHTIYVAKDISESEKTWVLKHESGHAIGKTREDLTDAYATSMTGRNPLYFRTAA